MDKVVNKKAFRLKRQFFLKPTTQVARNLLGCVLVRRVGKKIKRALIIETEAYVGPNDKASHASRGLTPRTKVMFGQAGHIYVYLIYGMYYCLNVVTEKNGYPAAVLIRSILLPPKKGREIEIISGPGRVCKYFKIDKRLNGEDVILSKKIWFERGLKVNTNKIKNDKRIGVDYAGSWKNKNWRFFVELEKN